MKPGFVHCPNHPLWEPMAFDSITNTYTCTAVTWPDDGPGHGVQCSVVLRLVLPSPDEADPMPTATLEADDILALSALEAYRMACLARHYDRRANEIYTLRQRFVQWQQRNVDKLKHHQWRDRNTT